MPSRYGCRAVGTSVAWRVFIVRRQGEACCQPSRWACWRRCSRRSRSSAHAVLHADVSAGMRHDVVELELPLSELRGGERAPFADEHGHDTQPELVDETRLEQRVGECEAAPDDDGAESLLQRGSRCGPDAAE